MIPNLHDPHDFGRLRELAADEAAIVNQEMKSMGDPLISEFMNDYPLVLIEWEDSAQPVPGWSWLEDHTWESVVKCRSVGWLVHDGKEVKALAPNTGNHGADESLQVSGVIRIPARCVIRQAVLTDPHS